MKSENHRGHSNRRGNFRGSYASKRGGRGQSKRGQGRGTGGSYNSGDTNRGTSQGARGLQTEQSKATVTQLSQTGQPTFSYREVLCNPRPKQEPEKNIALKQPTPITKTPTQPQNPRRNIHEPLQLYDLLDFSKTKPAKQEKKRKKKPENRTKKQISDNPNWATNERQIQRRRKERIAPKKKKLTPIKKAILLEREINGTTGPPSQPNSPPVVREYCTQNITVELNRACRCLLQELSRFQQRYREKNPNKAAAKKRLVCGLREVTRSIERKKSKCVIITPNIESVDAPGGLNSVLDEMIKSCKKNKVFLVFGMTRNSMGKAVGTKRLRVSAVSILDYQGAEQHFNLVVDLTKKARQLWNSQNRPKKKNPPIMSSSNHSISNPNENHPDQDSAVDNATADGNDQDSVLDNGTADGGDQDSVLDNATADGNDQDSVLDNAAADGNDQDCTDQGVYDEKDVLNHNIYDTNYHVNKNNVCRDDNATSNNSIGGSNDCTGNNSEEHNNENN
eukprot:CAMPEP_0174253202 /NCGR_PEP_ID=MMETSP0439-20130205/2584_1 /TAXON_ID=0 /ORGANISM="Stereomyxa ramosa, Strain Chinc5" /LENGTH=505 /DNA_ID=CAMNT_0015334107 /DNA_START=84 /DNA_END=1601 /DNA_ORIENTATION=-